MGNYITKESSILWGGDDWSCLLPEPVDAAKTTTLSSIGVGEESNREMKMVEKSCVKVKETKGPSFPSRNTTTTAGGTKVKIKITKIQLKELLSMVDEQGLSAKQALIQLLNFSDGYDHQTHQTVLEACHAKYI